MNSSAALTEFELIHAIARHVKPSTHVPVGIGDDAAVIAPTPNQHLVTTTDSLVLDRHFTSDWTPQDIGHLAMAANLSDLAAMAARPRWALLNMTLPKHSVYATQGWLDGFMQGFLSLDDGLALVGGNLSEGPLNIGVVLIGEVMPDQAITRSGAKVGDLLVVTGTLGDAAAAWTRRVDDTFFGLTLQERLHRPTPRLLAGQQAAGHVHAMIDLSDGLLADLSHLLDASSRDSAIPFLGAQIELHQLPTSNALKAINLCDAERWNLQLSGGNDYELLMSVRPSKLTPLLADLQSAKTDGTVIGEITTGGEIVLRDQDRNHFVPAKRGWDHFQEEDS